MAKLGINIRVLQSDNSGIGKYVFNLVSNIIKLDNENEYFLFSPSRDGMLLPPELAERKCVSWEKFGFSRGSVWSQLVKYFWDRYYLSCEINKYAVDLFHDPTYSLPLDLRCKSVVTVHDLSYLRYPQHCNWRTRLHAARVLPDAVRRANRIIVVSKSVKDDLIELLNVPPEKIDVVYSGVDSDYFIRPTGESEQQCLNKYALLAGPYFVSVAAMNPRKNIPNILRAFAQLAQKYKELKLVLVGKKIWRCTEIDKTINSLNLDGRVFFTGYVDEESLRILYANALALVYPSYYEGFGMPLLEAMAVGVPVITSNVSSMPEVVGDAGIMVNPYSFGDIYSAMEAIFTDQLLRQSLILKGQRRAHTFTWQNCAQATLAVYNHVLQNK